MSQDFDSQTLEYIPLLTKMTQTVKVELDNFNKNCYLDLIDDFDEDASLALRARCNLKGFSQLKHNCKSEDCFLINSVIVENQGEVPVRTLVIYAHMEPLDYACLPQIVKTGNSLHEYKDLEDQWDK